MTMSTAVVAARVDVATPPVPPTTAKSAATTTLKPRASTATTAVPARPFAHTGVKVTAGAWGSGALLVGVVLVILSKRVVESCFDPSVLPSHRRRH